jgi:hypothetical protein
MLARMLYPGHRGGGTVARIGTAPSLAADRRQAKRAPGGGGCAERAGGTAEGLDKAAKALAAYQGQAMKTQSGFQFGGRASAVAGARHARSSLIGRRSSTWHNLWITVLIIV